MKPYDTREPQPISAGLKPFHEELSERYERADSRTIGYIPKHNGKGRKRGDPPAGQHPWRNPKTSEPPASSEDRFSQAPSHCVQLVKDGQPLTERGAELLMQQKMRVLDQVVCKAARKTWAQPPHSKQTKQVHNYQRTLGRK